MIGSAAYKERAEGEAGPGEGRGVQCEARLIPELLHADPDGGLRRFVPVVLPGGSAADVPVWLAPSSTSVYRVEAFTVTGAEGLLRLLTGQPGVLEPPLGPVPVLLPEGAAPPAAAGLAERPGLRTEIVIQAGLSPEGVVESAVWVAGSLACGQRGPLPAEVREVWRALGLPGLVAGERLAVAGRVLAGVLLDRAGQELVAGLLDGLAPQDTAEVVLCAGGEALALPVELIRLGTAAGGEVGPLGLMPTAAVSRRPRAAQEDLGAATRPIPAGSATCPSATKSWGIWRSRPGTWPPPGPPTRPGWTSRPGWPPPTRPTPDGSASEKRCNRRSTASMADVREHSSRARIPPGDKERERGLDREPTR
jgi:hypothetical protein